MFIGSVLAFYNLPESLTKGNPHIEMSIGVYGNIFLFILNATLLTIGLLSVFKAILRIDSLDVVKKPFLWMGKNSLLIMCIHGILVNTALSIWKVLNIDSIPQELIVFLVTIIVLVLCYPVSKVVLLYVPNLIGRTETSK